MQKVMFTWSIPFEIDTLHKDEEGKPIVRKGVATAMAETAEQASLAFHDLVKKDKAWRKHKVLITELPKLVIHSFNNQGDGKKTVE